MAEVDIGIGKSGRRGYGFDDIAIVPSPRTIDPDDVRIAWDLAGFRLQLPMMASAMDSAVSPATAVPRVCRRYACETLIPENWLTTQK